MMRVVREGSNTVCVCFVATHAPYVARGWVKSLELLNGPTRFALYYNNVEVAATDTGVITIDNFSEQAREEMRRHTSPANCIALSGHFNMTYPGRVHLVLPEVPERQTYYVRQTWAQLFEQKSTATGTDMDLTEVPCIMAYNLRHDDVTATITRTTPIK